MHPEHPHEAVDTRGEVGHDAGLRSICAEHQATVEACMGPEVRVKVRQGGGGWRGKEQRTRGRHQSMHTHTACKKTC